MSFALLPEPTQHGRLGSWLIVSYMPPAVAALAVCKLCLIEKVLFYALLPSLHEMSSSDKEE